MLRIKLIMTAIGQKRSTFCSRLLFKCSQVSGPQISVADKDILVYRDHAAEATQQKAEDLRI